ncbi:MAG: biopolymer transporter ExbD [Bacteroidales bacterium]
MAEIIANEGGGKKGHGKRRAKKHSTHIDMTPMVDLMSLLITFFMLTTAFSKPKIMEIVLPDKTDNIDTSKGPEIEAKRTLNLLLSGDDRVYYYIGKPPMNDKDVESQKASVFKSDYGKDGLRKVILKMNLMLYERVDSVTQNVISGKSKISQDSLLAIIKQFKKQDKKGPIVMIKADKKAKYKNIVDVIDEMAICNVARYAIVDLNEYELKMIESAPK